MAISVLEGASKNKYGNDDILEDKFAQTLENARDFKSSQKRHLHKIMLHI